jgi:hypothetical protein
MLSGKLFMSEGNSKRLKAANTTIMDSTFSQMVEGTTLMEYSLTKMVKMNMADIMMMTFDTIQEKNT